MLVFGNLCFQSSQPYQPNAAVLMPCFQISLVCQYGSRGVLADLKFPKNLRVFSFALMQNGKAKWEMSLNWASFVLVEPIQWLLFVTDGLDLFTYIACKPCFQVLNFRLLTIFQVAIAVISKWNVLKNLTTMTRFWQHACLYFVASVACAI